MNPDFLGDRRRRRRDAGGHRTGGGGAGPGSRQRQPARILFRICAGRASPSPSATTTKWNCTSRTRSSPATVSAIGRGACARRRRPRRHPAADRVGRRIRPRRRQAGVHPRRRAQPQSHRCTPTAIPPGAKLRTRYTGRRRRSPTSRSAATPPPSTCWSMTASPARCCGMAGRTAWRPCTRAPSCWPPAGWAASSATPPIPKSPPAMASPWRTAPARRSATSSSCSSTPRRCTSRARRGFWSRRRCAAKARGCCNSRGERFMERYHPLERTRAARRGGARHCRRDGAHRRDVR